MTLRFDKARENYNSVLEALCLEVHDGDNPVTVIVERRALLEIEGLTQATPGALVSIYRAHKARIHMAAGLAHERRSGADGAVRVTSDLLNGRILRR